MTIAELQERFVRALAKRCGDIMDLIDRPDDLATLRRGFHSLAGIAGTYGYHAVTEVSRRCELLCADALDQNRGLTPFDRARLVAGISTIRMYGSPS